MSTAYRTVEPPDLAERVGAALDEGFDLVAFASPSAVEAFAAAARAGRPAGLSGRRHRPDDARPRRDAGFDVRAVAAPSTAEGLVGAVRAPFRAARVLDMKSR